MKIAILAYDRMTALDAIGPYEVLCRIANAKVQFIAATPGPICADTYGFHSNLALVADCPLEDLPDPDIIVIPGGSTGTMEVMRSERRLNWLRAAHASSQWTTSVCTGAFILGAAGLLQGLQATPQPPYTAGCAARATPELKQRSLQAIRSAGGMDEVARHGA